MILEDQDYIAHKKLILNCKNELCKFLSRLNKICSKLAILRKSTAKKLSDLEDLAGISELSKALNLLDDKMINEFAVRNRINMLISRCDDRLRFIENKLKSSGIYNENTQIHDYSSEIQNCNSKVSETSLNLNKYAENAVVAKLVKGQVLYFKNGKLDWSIDKNKEILFGLDENQIASLINMFPSSVSTIDEEILLNTDTKNKLLKQITLFVVQESKKSSIKDVNEKLGGLLSFKTEYTETPADFMVGVQNMFNVQIKNSLISQNPEQAEIIEKKLNCNEKSELIPKSKIVAVLANGLSGEVVKDENQESEELRIENEKQLAQTQQMINEMLDNALNETAQDQKSEQENQVDKKNDDEILKSHIEEQKKVKKEIEDDKKKKEVEAELKRIEEEYAKLGTLEAQQLSKYDD